MLCFDDTGRENGKPEKAEMMRARCMENGPVVKLCFEYAGQFCFHTENVSYAHLGIQQACILKKTDVKYRTLRGEPASRALFREKRGMKP